MTASNLAAADSPDPLAAEVSFGAHIKRPADLQRRTVGCVLLGVRDGEWRDPIERLRSLPHDSPAQREAKGLLPYFTPSGSFSRREAKHLITHSGLVQIDLDELAAGAALKVMQKALEDGYCLAAFRSSRGLGVRLMFRIPPREHKAGYAAAAAHVQKFYGVKPDASGSDVARACFVSFDGQLLIQSNALPLPVSPLPIHNEYPLYHCVSYPREEAPFWVWLAREYQPTLRRADGTAFTHHVLLELAHKLAFAAKRRKHWLGDAEIEAVIECWAKEAALRGFRLRNSLEDYAHELTAAIRGTMQQPWFEEAVQVWSRWKSEPGFPEAPAERLVFAIRRHCSATKRDRFFMSCRQAADLIGHRYPAPAARLLKKLTADGVIRLAPIKGKRLPRHALEYELVQPESLDKPKT